MIKNRSVNTLQKAIEHVPDFEHLRTSFDEAYKKLEEKDASI